MDYEIKQIKEEFLPNTIANLNKNKRLVELPEKEHGVYLTNNFERR